MGDWMILLNRVVLNFTSIIGIETSEYVLDGKSPICLVVPVVVEFLVCHLTGCYAITVVAIDW